MFTGIIEAVGRVTTRTPNEDGIGVEVDAGELPLEAVPVGGSIAVSGVCLTVTRRDGTRFTADVSGATLAATTLAALAAGTPVNLERALMPTMPLGGHLVSGHVDGVGEVLSLDDAGESRLLRVRAPSELARYIARKGSVCIDGASLTVNAVDGSEFEVNLVPHTLANTTLGVLGPGDTVNLEVDMIARYVERLMQGTNDA
ncbi:MAG: riboflavin synthase [Xanthomonadaceae bacterium]|nr:riboflavin synthase [Xanthomonadaceae bacterium]